MEGKLAVPFRRGKAWERRIAAFLPGAKLYGRGVSTPDFTWSPALLGSELQFEIKSTSSEAVIAETRTLRHAVGFSSVLAGYNGAIEIYEDLSFEPSSDTGDVPYTIKCKSAHTVLPLESMVFWFNNQHWFRTGDTRKGWPIRPSFPYYPPMGSKLKEIFHKGLKQLQRYLDNNNARGGGIVIAATGQRTRDQLCIIPNTFLGQQEGQWEIQTRTPVD